MSFLPAEVQLFLLSIKPADETDDVAISALARSSLDWGMLTHLAERERLLSVMWNRLRPFPSSAPQEIVSHFRRRTMIVEFQMSATRKLLNDVVGLLADR